MTPTAATHQNRPMTVSTPLGKDVLLLVGFTGQESLSHLFNYQLDLQAHNRTAIAFDKLLGKSITVEMEMSGRSKRYFNGVCTRFGQGNRDQEFTNYRMELVPELWLLSKVARSRTFQHMSVPDILKKVLGQLGTKPNFQLEGTFEPRDYCVQYRETDFNFASRLMEEEGIYYYFLHNNGSHTMVVANSPAGHATDTSTVTYKARDHLRDSPGTVYEWVKVQELRAGKYTLWDHCFEKPDSHLDASKSIAPDVQVGKVSHKLNVGENGPLELYDFPGEYAQRFDGVDKGGGDQPSELSKIFADNQRTVQIRMEEEAVPSLLLQGASSCRQFNAGNKFSLSTLSGTLENQANADGQYVLTSVQHSFRLPGFYSGTGSTVTYQNSFTCIPAALPYRPARTTPKPVVHGTQSAVVVGPSGEEIFTDKYGRVKVQFFWDREGKNNADSSCWCRVGTLWAGQQWGAIHIPRIGQEVIVAYEEGDPDRPIIVGSVYNASMMPPYKLPDNKTQSGIMSRSSLKGGSANFNELRFEDKKDKEEVYFHAEKDFNRVVENNDTLKVGSAQADDGSQTIEIWKDRTETVKTGNEKVTIEQGNRTVQISMGNDTLQIKMGNQSTKLDLGKSETEAMQSIELIVGQSSVKLDQMGVTIKGMMIQIQGQIQTQVQGTMTQINGDAMLKMQGGITMIN